MLALAGCSSATAPATTAAHQPGIPAASPRLLMTAADTGYAVWPSGAAWVILSTSDGWQHVRNATPAAVPTGGGMVLAARPGELAAAIAPFDRLTTSPILTAPTSTTNWTPAELPAGISAGRDTVAFDDQTLTALVAQRGGTLERMVAGSWQQVIAAADLNGGLSIDGVRWAGAGVGWITGRSAAGSPVAFYTRDNGLHWAPAPGLSSTAVRSFAPCGSQHSWTLPVLTAGGSIVVYSSTDTGLTWHAGTPVRPATAQLAWSCRGAQLWLAAESGLVVSADSGSSWHTAGRLPAGVTDLAITGDSAGFAVTKANGHAALWRVQLDGTVRLSRITLPDWVNRVGATMGSS